MTLFLLISHIQSDCFAVKGRDHISAFLSDSDQRGACRVEHNHNHNHNQCKPESKRSWGRHRLICHALDLPDDIRNISNFLVFRRLIRNM